MKYYIFCFDIADDKARYRVGKILLNYGKRVQGSVFELALTHHGVIAHILRQTTPFIDPKTDDLRYYYLSCASLQRSKTLEGKPIQQVPKTVFI